MFSEMRWKLFKVIRSKCDRQLFSSVDIVKYGYANLTPVAGLIFETKIESFFLESFFLERNYCPRTDFSGSNPCSIFKSSSKLVK